MPRDGAGRCDPSEHSCPAAALGRTDIGRLEVGAIGDATVLELAEGDFEYRDVLGEVRAGRQRLKARGVVLAGTWWHPPRACPSRGLFPGAPRGVWRSVSASGFRRARRLLPEHFRAYSGNTSGPRTVHDRMLAQHAVVSLNTAGGVRLQLRLGFFGE